MEIITKFKPGDWVYTNRYNMLQRYVITGVIVTVIPSGIPLIEYQLWTEGSGDILVPQEVCFANEDEVRADLEKRLQELSNQES
jgi:hypothetical protein